MMTFFFQKNPYGCFLYFKLISNLLSHIPLPNLHQSFCLSSLFPDNFTFTFIQLMHIWFYVTIWNLGNHDREKTGGICLRLAWFTQFDYLQLLPFLANGMISIFFMAKYNPIVGINVFCIRCPVGGHLRCFLALAIMSGAQTILTFKHPWLRVLEVNTHERAVSWYIFSSKDPSAIP